MTTSDSTQAMDSDRTDAGSGVRADGALDMFVVEHYDRLIRLARLICRDGSDAADAVQVALEQAWRRRSSLRHDGSLRPWIDRIVAREAIRIAVRRYHLYDIDRIMSRTISYGVLNAILLGLFAGFIVAMQAVPTPLTRSNDVAVAASTLAVFSLFQPLRHRVQAVIDRRFNRARVDADRTAAAFTVRLREEVDLEHLGSEITAAVGRTVQPVTVSLWLRE